MLHARCSLSLSLTMIRREQWIAGDWHGGGEQDNEGTVRLEPGDGKRRRARQNRVAIEPCGGLLRVAARWIRQGLMMMMLRATPAVSLLEPLLKN